MAMLQTHDQLKSNLTIASPHAPTETRQPPKRQFRTEARAGAIPPPLIKGTTAERAAEIGAAYAAWCAALNGHDARKITDLYAEDATLLATFAHDPIRSHDGIQNYFAELVRKDGLRVETKELEIREGFAEGLYTFRFSENGRRQEVDARFTFNFIKERGRMRIASHHSSIQPS